MTTALKEKPPTTAARRDDVGDRRLDALVDEVVRLRNEHERKKKALEEEVAVATREIENSPQRRLAKARTELSVLYLAGPSSALLEAEAKLCRATEGYSTLDAGLRDAMRRADNAGFDTASAEERERHHGRRDAIGVVRKELREEILGSDDAEKKIRELARQFDISLEQPEASNV